MALFFWHILPCKQILCKLIGAAVKTPLPDGSGEFSAAHLVPGVPSLIHSVKSGGAFLGQGSGFQVHSTSRSS